MSTISSAPDTFDKNILQVVVQDLQDYLKDNFGLKTSFKKRIITASSTEHVTKYHYVIYVAPLTWLYKISSFTFVNDTKHVEYVYVECPVLDVTKKLSLREFVSNIGLIHEIEHWTKSKAELMLSVVQNEHKKKSQLYDDESASHYGHTLPNFDSMEEANVSHHGHVMTRNANDLHAILERLHLRVLKLESKYGM